MGGLGALTIALKNPGKYRSVSAFAPIANLAETNWGKKASEGFLGSVEAGKDYDPTKLITTYEGVKIPMLID
jgi:S-formylglutathione hydrolase